MYDKASEQFPSCRIQVRVDILTSICFIVFCCLPLLHSGTVYSSPLVMNSPAQSGSLASEKMSKMQSKLYIQDMLMVWPLLVNRWLIDVPSAALG